MGNREEKLETRIQELETEIKNLKQEVKETGSTSEYTHNETDTDKPAFSRRDFIKTLGLGTLGLGAASMIPGATALDIHDSNGLSVYSDNTNYFNVNPGGPVEVLNADLDLDDDLVDGNTVIWDSTNNHIPQDRLENDAVSVAGNSVSLGDSTSINHGDLSNISSDDHHSRYTDSEAVNAVESESNLSLNSGVNIGTGNTNRDLNVGNWIYADTGLLMGGNDWAGRIDWNSSGNYVRIGTNNGNSSALRVYESDTVRVADGTLQAYGNGIRVQNSDRHSYNGITSTTSNNGHLMLDSNGGNLYLNWDETNNQIRLYGSQTRVHSNLSMESNDMSGVRRITGYQSNQRIRFDRSSNYIEIDDGSGNRDNLVVGDIYINDLNGGNWMASNGVTSSSGTYDIQKNGSDSNGVINFKT